MINEYQICSKIFKRYIIVRVRQKLSWHAFVLKLTVKELFFFALLKTYQVQLHQGDSKDSLQCSSEGMFTQFFGAEFDARNFNVNIPNINLLPED